MKFAKYFDHTLLKPEATEADIKKLCAEAREYDFASVCVNSCYAEYAAQQLTDCDVNVCCVVGFPLGAMCTDAKAFEADMACSAGASEIDMVISIGALRDGRFDDVSDDIAAVAGIVYEHDAILKVILETCLLTDEEIKKACTIAVDAGADFVKTSTGFSAGGAEADKVRLMKETVGDEAKVKASGGIRDLAAAEKMIEAGASRIGTSAAVSIMKEGIASGIVQEE
jgi:deoxyribose-phosphate aldolase